MTVISEYMVKLENSYKEITTLREKLIWFEKEHQSMDATIINLKAQLEQSQIQLTSSFQEITTLRSQLQQFQTVCQNSQN
jgi:chromosome segregation ATPase